MVRVALPRTETQHRLTVLLPLQIRSGHRPGSQNADAARQSLHQDRGGDGRQRGGSHRTADPALRRFRRLSGLPLAQPAEIRPEPPVAAPSPSGGMPAEIHPQRRHAADASADLRDTRIQKGLTAGGKTFFRGRSKRADTPVRRSCTHADRPCGVQRTPAIRHV